MGKTKKNINNQEQLHQGKLLENLCLKSNQNLTDIAFHLDITYQWLNQNFKRDLLPKKIIAKAISYFQLPADFFQTGKLPQSTANEPGTTYGSVSPEIIMLKNEIREKEKTIIELQAQIIRLLNEVKK